MTPPAAPPGSAAAAAADAGSARIAALADEYWRQRLRADPIEATVLGYRQHDAEMPDVTAAGHARETARWEGLLVRVRAVDAHALTDGDRVTHGTLIGEIEADLARRACHLEEWTVDPRDGPQVGFLNLARLQSVGSPEQAAAMVSRWQKMAPLLDDMAANLRRGLAAGKVAPRGAVERVIKQLDDLLGSPDEAWVLYQPLAALRAAAPAIRSAFERYRQLLAREILPQARDDARVGISHIPDGAACYARLIKVHTSLDASAEEIHQFGLQEVARIRREMSDLGGEVLGTMDLSEIQRRLRGDPALFFTTREEIETKAVEALRRSEAAVGRWLGRLPRTPCGVRRIEPYEEKDSTIAYYRQAAIDGTRPGSYYVNTYAPATRPRYEAEVLAFHESVPGHHTQIAIAQELTGIPEFRKHAGVTAFVEGWALYTERLANEMGLYSGDLDRMGMLSFDAWRASRLVVDTGMHVKRWSRQQAEKFMIENTVLAENNIANEVDRYIGWPGQALAYKMGQREILRLRVEAERRLGAQFDIRAFHDVVLGSGAVSLPVLRQQVARWMADVGPR